MGPQPGSILFLWPMGRSGKNGLIWHLREKFLFFNDLFFPIKIFFLPLETNCNLRNHLVFLKKYY
ncbi:hypothetical protein C7I86_16390 [Synechocystis sp. IPPAS B-1465]|jgi:hypothetical protein|nr:hypothetical protein C7I86_16390 [Synechocystis sp. IPPAS B-1465]